MRLSIKYWLALVILGVAACSRTSAAANSPTVLHDELLSDYEGKRVMLRHFYCGRDLKFDMQGKLLSKWVPGVWTLCRDIQTEKVKLRDGKLKIQGQRIFLFYDSTQNRFRDVLEIANKKNDKYKDLIRSQQVSIEIELPPNADGHTVQTAMDTIFYRSQEEFSKDVPSFWSTLLFKLESSSKPQTGSKPDDGMNRSPQPVSSQASSGGNPPAPAGLPDVSILRSGPFHIGNGVFAPIPIYQPDPNYSDAARMSFYQGTVTMDVVIGADGKVHSMSLTHCLGLGLDENAMDKVSTWRFKPATKDGRPVAVLVSVEVTFNLY